MNVIIAVVIALVLTIVTLAVIWLCYNSTSDTAVKNISLATPHQFSSTSSTSMSNSSAEKYPKSLSTALITTESATIEAQAFNGGEMMKRAIFSEPPPPPPPPQIPLPKAPLPKINLPIPFITSQAQQLLQQTQQQQQRLLENHLTHHSQMHLHNDISSPLLGGTSHYPQNYLQNGNTSIGELLYPSSMTLDRRYLNQQRIMPNPYTQHHQYILHRTKADDEMSRLSSHIYDILAVSSPIPPHTAKSPPLIRQNQQNKISNKITHYSQQQLQIQDWNCAQKYTPPPAPPPSLPPPSHAHPTTPVSTMTENDDCKPFTDEDFASQSCWNNPSIPHSLSHPNTSKVLNDHQFHQPRRQTQVTVGNGANQQ